MTRANESAPITDQGAPSTRTNSNPPPPRTIADLLDDAATLIAEAWVADTGWEPFALDVVGAAKQRRDGVPLSDELETLLRLANRLLAGHFRVSSALLIIEALPDFPADLLDRDRPTEPAYRRSGVNHLAYVEDAES